MVALVLFGFTVVGWYLALSADNVPLLARILLALVPTFFLCGGLTAVITGGSTITVKSDAIQQERKGREIRIPWADVGEIFISMGRYEFSPMEYQIYICSRSGHNLISFSNGIEGFQDLVTLIDERTSEISRRSISFTRMVVLELKVAWSLFGGHG